MPDVVKKGARPSSTGVNAGAIFMMKDDSAPPGYCSMPPLTGMFDDPV